MKLTQAAKEKYGSKIKDLTVDIELLGYYRGRVDVKINVFDGDDDRLLESDVKRVAIGDKIQLNGFELDFTPEINE